MNLFTSLIGGEKSNHLIASGAAFATIWGFFFAANILLIVVSSALLVLYNKEDNECDDVHQDYIMKLGATGVGLGCFFMIPMIVVYIVNDRWIEQFSITEMNPLIRTATEHQRLVNQKAQ